MSKRRKSGCSLIPSAFWYRRRKYVVEYVPRKELERGNWGDFSPTSQEIRIREDLSTTSQRITELHEVLHIVCDYLSQKYPNFLLTHENLDRIAVELERILL